MSVRRVSVVAAIALPAVMGLCDVTRGAAQNSEPPLNPMAALHRDAFEDFRTRPLFDPSRRLPPVAPGPVVAEIEAAQPGPPPALQLLGVMKGKRDMAFARRDGARDMVTLRTGDCLDGWSVTVRPPLGVRLRRNEQIFDYTLFSKQTAGTRVILPPVKSEPVTSLPPPPVPIGQTDAIGMPDVYPDQAFKIRPN